MEFFTQTLRLKTEKELEFIDITGKILHIVNKSKIKEGFLNVFSKHTTMAIEINEYEPQLLKDMEWFMKEIVPEKRKYFHDNIKLRKNYPPKEPANAKGHLRSMLMGASQIVPIINYKLQLGRYQKIIAVETSGPRERELIIQIFGEGGK